MKYSIKFYKGCRMLSKVDEISIIYDKKDAQILKFGKKYKNARIVADCTSLTYEELLDNIEIFKTASNNFEFVVKINYEQKDILPDLTDNMIKYFFADHVNTVDKLRGFINLGVSDIYVIDELAFSLGKIAPMCHDNKVNIRVFPNVAQSSTSIPNDTFKNFFIRPEDISAYEDYVDYCEFWGPLDRQSVLFKIYKEGQWLGSLNTLILGLEREIPNTCIVPYFGRARVNCDKRCAYGKCEVCSNIKDLADVLEHRDFGITTERKRMDERINIIKEEEDDEDADFTGSD